MNFLSCSEAGQVRVSAIIELSLAAAIVELSLSYLLAIFSYLQLALVMNFLNECLKMYCAAFHSVGPVKLKFPLPLS